MLGGAELCNPVTVTVLIDLLSRPDLWRIDVAVPPERTDIDRKWLFTRSPFSTGGPKLDIKHVFGPTIRLKCNSAKLNNVTEPCFTDGGGYTLGTASSLTPGKV